MDGPKIEVNRNRNIYIYIYICYLDETVNETPTPQELQSLSHSTLFPYYLGITLIHPFPLRSILYLCGSTWLMAIPKFKSIELSLWFLHHLYMVTCIIVQWRKEQSEMKNIKQKNGEQSINHKCIMADKRD